MARPDVTVQLESVLASLCLDLQAWCARNSLPYESACDLLATTLPTQQQRAWIQAFIDAWDATESALQNAYFLELIKSNAPHNASATR